MSSTDSTTPYLLDTNVLLRSIHTTDPLYGTAVAALDTLRERGATLFIAMQTVAEFWNVSTRPADKNGYGLSLGAVTTQLSEVENLYPILYEDAASFQQWRTLVTRVGVSGVQVHDARLAALMIVHGIPAILTFNARDFARYGVTPVDPHTLIGGTTASDEQTT